MDMVSQRKMRGKRCKYVEKEKEEILYIEKRLKKEGTRKILKQTFRKRKSQERDIQKEQDKVQRDIKRAKVRREIQKGQEKGERYRKGKSNERDIERARVRRQIQKEQEKERDIQYKEQE